MKLLRNECLKSQASRSYKKVKEILKGHEQINSKRIAMAGRSRWSKDIRKTRVKIWEDGEDDQGDVRPLEIQEVDLEGGEVRTVAGPTKEEDEAEETFFSWKACCTKVTSCRKGFDIHDLGKLTWCNKCQKSRPVVNFNCPCRVAWHVCESHREAPTKSRRHHEAVAVKKKEEYERNKKPRKEKVPNRKSIVKKAFVEKERKESKATSSTYVCCESTFEKVRDSWLCRNANRGLSEQPQIVSSRAEAAGVSLVKRLRFDANGSPWTMYSR